MRSLTSEQKRELKKWFVSNYPENTGYSVFDLSDKMDYETYNRIDELNPTEVYKQNVNNYLEGLAIK